MGSAQLDLSHLPKVIPHFLSLGKGGSRKGFPTVLVATAWQIGERGGGESEQELPGAQLGSPLLSLVLLGLSQSSSKYFKEHLLCTQPWDSILNFSQFFRLFIIQKRKRKKKSVAIVYLVFTTCHMLC